MPLLFWKQEIRPYEKLGYGIYKVEKGENELLFAFMREPRIDLQIPVCQTEQLR